MASAVAVDMVARTFAAAEGERDIDRDAAVVEFAWLGLVGQPVKPEVAVECHLR